jgi:hypothetical protein
MQGTSTIDDKDSANSDFVKQFFRQQQMEDLQEP